MTATELTAQQRRANQIKALILWLIPVGLMACAGIVYYLVQTGQMTLGSKNHGSLLRPPVQLVELLADNPTLKKADEDNQPVSVFEGKWSLVVRGDRECSQRCRDALYLTRQLHIRLDKNANRVQRIYLYDAPANGSGPNALSRELAEHFKSEHRLLQSFPVDPAEIAVLDENLLSSDGEPARFFLVDPQGWAMMYYLDQHEGNAMLGDLKHLLKYSRER